MHLGGVAIGTTYALFTSEANNQIEVVSGKVSVTSTLTVKEVYSPTLINAADGVIVDSTNNTSADIKAEVSEDGNSVSITNMLPGDKVVVTVTPTNNSNVDIKFREIYSFSGETAAEDDPVKQLKISGDEAMVKNWTKLAANGTIEAYDITIELPTTATEEIEGASIKLGVEAVQGNAAVYDTTVSSESELTAALDSSEPNVSVKLADDIVLTEYLKVKGNTTIYGDGDTKITAPTGSSSRVINIDSEEVPENQTESATLQLVGLNLVGKAEGTNEYDRGISAWGNKDLTLILEDCAVSCGHYALNIAGDNKKVSIIARNSTFEGYSALNFWSSTTATFENCTLIGNNDFERDDWNNCGTIAVNCAGVSLNLTNCRIEANQTTGNKQRFFQIDDRFTATINVKDSTFWINGVEQTTKSDIENNISGDTTGITIVGTQA